MTESFGIAEKQTTTSFVEQERWKKIDELFDAVLNLPEPERDAFLSRECSGDDDLRNKVLELLAAMGPTSFLERSAIGIVARNTSDEKDTLTDRGFVGRTIGTYEIEKQIAAGGMGEVYLATDSKFYRKVALKILRAEYTSDDERLKRFELEAHAISCINHPNIVTIYDVGNIDGVNFIATELVEGKNLKEAAPDLNFGDILGVSIQVCKALSAAHTSGITHRDIKPENIMLRTDGYVKVLDFGIAKLSHFSKNEADFVHTAEGVIMGTPGYMSPEQVAGERVDYRTDIWSLGVILFELLTGRNPFKGLNRQQTFTAILDSDPPAASSINPAVPAEMDRILERSLKKNSDLRYQSPSELSADLKQIKRQHDAKLSRRGNSGKVSETAAGPRRYFQYALVGLVPVVVLGLIGGFLFTRGRTATDVADWSQARSVQLTSIAGTEYFPAISPDGNAYVYAADQAGNFDIYSKRLGGTNPVNLTQASTADDTQPAYSPNGLFIAFRSEREPAGVYLMEATGENPRRVADFGFHPSFSPDGKSIVVSTFGDDQPTVRRGGPHGLFTINVETGERRQISSREASFPTWSPDGKYVAFWFYPALAGRRDVAIVSVDGGKEVVLTDGFAVSNWNPVWAPDGNFVYFTSDRNGSVNFWRVRINTDKGDPLSAPEPVLSPSSYSRHLNFSHDGMKMIYVQSNNQANVQGVQFDPVAGAVIGNPFWITTGDREVSRAEVSPDGREFLMRRIRRTQDDIVLYDRDANAWRDITHDVAFDRYPRWAPGGKQIAFASDRGGKYEIWTCARDGSNLKQITFVGDSETGTSFPTWSPNGNELIYTVNRRSYIIDVNKEWSEQVPRPLPLPQDGSNFVVWDWAPDGKKLAGTFGYGNRALGIYSFETGLFKRVADIPTSDPMAIPTWLPDSRRIVFRSEGRILLLDTVTGDRKELITEKEGEFRSPFVSKDGTLLYYVVQINESNIWLLDRSSRE